MKSFIISILLLFLSSIVCGQGTVINDSFFSDSLNATRSVDVYLPEGYDSNVNVNYPVIYYLHGGAEDHQEFSGPLLTSAVDDLIDNQLIDPVIVVLPDGTGGPYLASWTSSELYGQLEAYVLVDLVTYVDANYRTIASRNSRSIMGWSGGGFGAMQLALKHPDVYRGVAAHSGVLDLDLLLQDWTPLVLAENGDSPPYDYTPSAGFFTLVLFTGAGAFSPNLENPPFFVDFPLDSDGNLIESVFAEWRPHSPVELAAAFSSDGEDDDDDAGEAEEEDLEIYLDCGQQDEFLLFPQAVSFADALEQLDLEYDFQSYTGGHGDRLADRFPVSLVFLVDAMSDDE